MANIFVGKLEKKQSKDGKVDYFTGSLNGVPVKAFFKKNDSNVLNISLDVDKIKWINEQPVSKGKDEEPPAAAPTETSQ